VDDDPRFARPLPFASVNIATGTLQTAGVAAEVLAALTAAAGTGTSLNAAAALLTASGFFAAARQSTGLPVSGIPPLAARALRNDRSAPPLLTPLATGLSMKPVGLEHPQTGERPYAVVQLRKEDLSDEYFNMVGFQTKMKVPEQNRMLQMIPGLENCTFARFGSMHRNTFINGPKHLTPTFQAKRDPQIFFAGQVTGVEGYVESSAVGLLVARYIAELARGDSARPLPYHTALGALGRHVAESSPERYQPSNVTWALIEDVVGKVKKAEKREKQVARAIQTIEQQTLALPFHR